MRCRVCKEKAVVRTVSGPLCEEHFKEYYERKVRETIEKYKMFSKEDKILVAVSGGKDSSALAFVLQKLGYDFEGLYIDLEIEGYSEHCLKSVKKLFKFIGKPLNIVKLSEFGVKIEKVGPRPVCSVCGIVKRYLMNKFAYENGFKVVATGHNLNDEAAFFLNNLFGNKIELLLKQSPVSKESEKLVRKARPLYFLTEKENLIYCLLNNIPACNIECPNARGNTQIAWKKMIYDLERKRPFFSYHFVRSMLKLIKRIQKEEKITGFCKICGYPTESRDGICSFCKIREYFKRK